MMVIRRPRLSIRFLFTAVFSVAVIVVVGFRLHESYYTYPLSDVVNAINHAALQANRPELCVTEDFLVDAIKSQIANSTGKEQLLSGNYSRVSNKLRWIASRRRVALGDGFNMTENGVLWLVVSVPRDITVTPGPGFGLIIRHPLIGKRQAVTLNPVADSLYSWDGKQWRHHDLTQIP